jgi:hypothetical protein
MTEPKPAYSVPFTTDVPQCCGSPETCNEPCQGGCAEHEWEYHEETYGADGVIGAIGRQCFVRCLICGAEEPTTREACSDD